MWAHQRYSEHHLCQAEQDFAGERQHRQTADEQPAGNQKNQQGRYTVNRQPQRQCGGLFLSPLTHRANSPCV